jgi:uncharacterized protein (DUF1684 family)
MGRRSLPSPLAGEGPGVRGQPHAANQTPYHDRKRFRTRIPAKTRCPMPRLLAVVLVAAFVVSCHSVAQSPPKERFIEVAESVVKAINAADAESLRRDFGDAMLKALPADKCKELFAHLKSSFGPIQKLEPPTLTPPGKAVFIARGERNPAEMTLSLDAKGKVAGLRFLPYSDIPVPSRNETTMALPFAGKMLVFWGGETAEQSGHHFKDRPQKFAYDLVGIGDGGKSHLGKGTRNEDYHCFGREIYAPAEGVVLEVVDGVHDNVPGVMNAYSALGNAIFIQHAKHEISLLAHLKQHSIQVKPGDKVKRGQVLGLCGNSGNSSEPHLHFHLQNTPKIEDATGIRCFFEAVTVEKNGKTDVRLSHMPQKGEVISGVSLKDVYLAELRAWRDLREKKLRADNGWLTLAGRYPLKPGENTIGVGKDNAIVFPPELKGTGPDRLGVIFVDADAKRVTLRLPNGVDFIAGEKTFSGERVFALDKPDWVGLGRLRFHVIVRDGTYILRLADNESALRKNFPGCVWYPPDERFKVEATFIAYPPGKTISVTNVLDQTAQQPSPGYAEFRIGGETHKLDAIAEDAGLFFIFRDATAGDTTYKPARFLTVEKRPKDGETFTLDFNKAYNPPCAVSEFTTCPVAPRQNVLKVRIEAGEKFGR